MWNIYIKRKKNKEKMQKRKGENKGWHLKCFFISPLFLLYKLFISLDLLYFRSRSCNGFTPLCFSLVLILSLGLQRSLQNIFVGFHWILQECNVVQNIFIIGSFRKWQKHQKLSLDNKNKIFSWFLN